MRNSVDWLKNKLDITEEEINELGGTRKYPERITKRKKSVKIKKEQNESIRGRGNSDKV